MTITYVGTGAAATAVNAGVTPAFPAGIAIGDALIIVASVRNSGVGTPFPPDGWTALVAFGNLAVLGRIYTTGDVAPLVTFADSVANADTIARCFAFRGAATAVAALLAGSATLLNGSAQNIAYPGLTPPGANEALLLVGWKQDDNTSVTTPAGWTLVGSTSTTTGDDASQWTGYQIQTTATAITAGSITVTGGAAAISRGVVLALRPAAVISVTEQDAYPPRTAISITNIAAGEQVDIYRVVAGERSLVRGGSVLSTSNAVVRLDAELPMGVPVSYTAVVAGAEYSSAPVTYVLPGGKVALSDAIAGTAAEVVIMSWPQKLRRRDATAYRVGGRNVVVSGPRAGFEAEIELYVDSTSAVNELYALLSTATQGIVQMRQAGGYDGIDCYLAVTDDSERRWSQDGSDERRLITVTAFEVDGWSTTLEDAGFTLQDIADTYVGLTLTDLSNDFATLLDVSLADFL